MITYCGRPAAAYFCDPFPYIEPSYARETIAEICSLGVASLRRSLVRQAPRRAPFPVSYKHIPGILEPWAQPYVRGVLCVDS